MLDGEGKAKSLSEIVGDLAGSMDGMTESQKVATLAKLVGTEAVSGFLALTKAGPTEIDKMSESLRNSGGASKEAAAKMKDGIGGALENLSGAFETMAISIGDQLVPYVQIAAEWLAKLAEKFTGLSEPVKKFLVVGTAIAGIFAAIGAVIGIVLMVVGGAISGLSAIAGVMGIAGGAAGLLSSAFAVLTGPIGLAIAAIVGIVAALVIAYKKIDWFRDLVDKTWATIKEATAKAFEAIKKTVSTIIADVVKFGSEQLAKFKAFWDENGKAIMIIVKGAFDNVLTVIQTVMGIIKGVFQIVWPLIVAVLKYAWETIKLVVSTAINIVLGIIQAILKVLQGDWKGAWEAIWGTVKKIWADIGKFLEGLDLKGTGKQIIQGLINGLTSMGSALINGVKKIGDSIKNTFTKLFDINSPSRWAHDVVGRNIGIGIANGVDSTKALNQAVMNELGAVIAGVAKSNASEVAVINKTASAEQSAIARKATADIAEIYARAHDAKRKLTSAEVRKIAKIEDDADAKIAANKRKHKAEIAKIDQQSASERMSAIQKFLDNKNKLEELSLIDEVNIWRKAAASFKDGTQEKIDAQANYRDALAKVNAEITSINETYAGKMSAINDKLRSDELALTKTYTDSLNSRMSSLMSFAGIFDAFDVKVEQSGTELLSNLNSQVDGFKLWQSEIEKISGKAIDAGLLEELRQMGPKALPQLLALNSLTDAQLTEYSSLYKEKSLLARQQAEAELVGMKADTAKRITELRATANAELSLLQTEWTTKIKGVTKATNDEFKNLTQIGKNAGQNLLSGLASMESALVAQATAIARAVNSALQTTLGGSVTVAPYKTPSTSTGVKATSLSTGTSSAKAGGITQNVTINSTTPLSPAEIARKNKQAAQQLAMEWR